MDDWKKVTKEEFDKFIKNYPRPLRTNFFMDWLSYYDFPDGYDEFTKCSNPYAFKVAELTECYINEYWIKVKAENE